MYNVDLSSISHALNDMKKVISDKEKNSDYEFNFHSFKSKNFPHRLAAIDGSNHDVKGTNFVFSTLRTGYLLYEKDNIIKKNIDPITVEFIMNNNDSNVGFEYKHEKYYHSITGELPQGKLDFDKVTDRIRTLLEWDKVNSLIDDLEKNDIIIFDGSLISGEISTSHTFFKSLCEKARTKGISLVGLSKDTSLSVDSASLPLVLLESSKKHHAEKNWYVKYDDVDYSYFVKFSKKRDLVYRVDVVLPEHLSFEEVVSSVGSYCFDKPFGYPFPMQKIHDAVRISEMERDYCLNRFRKECLNNGISRENYEKMFQIYHDSLDKMSYGR